MHVVREKDEEFTFEIYVMRKNVDSHNVSFGADHKAKTLEVFHHYELTAILQNFLKSSPINSGRLAALLQERMDLASDADLKH